ncbi:MAG TPA: STAS domain-containing protein [Rhodocyclaceae bacterium]|nr:STAS domain-containing protein [Rhodocyclaceae bacterium]
MATPVDHRRPGTVERTDDATAIKGFLDFETAFLVLQQIRSGSKKIDLSGCQEMDSAGVGVLLIAQRQAVKLKGCQGKVRLMANIAGVCRGCPPDTGCPDCSP